MADARELTDEQIRAISVQFYEELGRRHPELRFHFATLDLDRLASKLVAMLRLVIAHRTDPTQLGASVIKVGVTHAGRGISRAEYGAFVATLADTLAAAQDRLPSDDVRSVWIDELSAVADLMLIVSDT
jgi:hemoglobin-like flavoprotein